MLLKTSLALLLAAGTVNADPQPILFDTLATVQQALVFNALKALQATQWCSAINTVKDVTKTSTPIATSTSVVFSTATETVTTTPTETAAPTTSTITALPAATVQATITGAPVTSTVGTETISQTITITAPTSTSTAYDSTTISETATETNTETETITTTPATFTQTNCLNPTAGAEEKTRKRGILNGPSPAQINAAIKGYNNAIISSACASLVKATTYSTVAPTSTQVVFSTSSVSTTATATAPAVTTTPTELTTTTDTVTETVTETPTVGFTETITTTEYEMSTPVSIVTQTDTSTTVVATETSTRTTTGTASYPTPTKYSNPCKQVYAQFYNIDAPFYDYEDFGVLSTAQCVNTCQTRWGNFPDFYLATARITPGDTSGGASHCWCKQRAAVAALADPGYRQKYGDPQRVNMVRATCAELTQVLGGADVGCQDVTFTIDDF